MKSKNLKANLGVSALVQDTIIQGEGTLSDTGALIINTGKFTGRSPKDRYIVEDKITRETIDWGEINIPISPRVFDDLEKDMLSYAESLDQVYVRDAYACASRLYRINIKVYTEFPWQSMFAYNMFLRPDGEHIENLQSDEWKIFAFPGSKANPEIHGTRQENFSMINFSKKTIIIGGTAYTGEIKKGIFFCVKLCPTDSEEGFEYALLCQRGFKGRYSFIFWFIGYRKNDSFKRSQSQTNW